MSLFAYTGDEDDNHFAQAFSQSRLLKWQGSKAPKADHQVDPSTISNDLASKKIWEMEANAPKLEFHPPSLYSNSSQHSLLGAESPLGLYNAKPTDLLAQRLGGLSTSSCPNDGRSSARSGRSSNSSGSSLTEEIFANIPHGFEEDADKEADNSLLEASQTSSVSPAELTAYSQEN